MSSEQWKTGGAEAEENHGSTRMDTDVEEGRAEFWTAAWDLDEAVALPGGVTASRADTQGANGLMVRSEASGVTEATLAVRSVPAYWQATGPVFPLE